MRMFRLLPALVGIAGAALLIVCAGVGTGLAQGFLTDEHEIGVSLGYSEAHHPPDHAGAVRVGISLKGWFDVGFGTIRQDARRDGRGYTEFASLRNVDLGLYNLRKADRESRVRDMGARLGFSWLWGDDTRGTAVVLELYWVEPSYRQILVVPSVGGGVVSKSGGGSSYLVGAEILMGARLTHSITLLAGPAISIVRKDFIYGGSIGLVTAVGLPRRGDREWGRR